MTDTLTSLADHLLAEGPDLDTSDDEAVERWEVTDDSAANWALRKIARAETEATRVRDQARAARQAADEWEEAALAEPARTVRVMEGKLIAYRLRLEDADPALPKTYRLPAGRIQRRQAQPKVRVSERDAFVAWATGRLPDALVVTVRTSALNPEASIKRVIDAGPNALGVLMDELSGEVVPGVDVHRGEDTYSVTVASEHADAEF